MVTVRDKWSRAIEKGDLRTVQKMIKDGVDVNTKDTEGRTALHWAALNGNARMTQVLIKAGASVHAMSLNGRTPLQVSVFGGYTEVSGLLIREGAEFNILPEVAAEMFTIACLFCWSLLRLDPKILHIFFQFHAGYANWFIPAMLDTQDLPGAKHYLPKLPSWYREEVNTVLTLRKVCRISLRKYLSRIPKNTCAEGQVDELPLPSALKNFLLFKDFDDINNNDDDDDDDDGEDGDVCGCCHIA